MNLIIILLFFLVGLFSDIKILKSPILRLILQIFCTFLFLYYNEIRLENTRILFLDNILNYQIINYLFLIFCITIIINGSNFIDGVNCNVIGYYILITLIIFKLIFINNLNIDIEQLKFWLLILLVIYILNLFSKLFLGDNGAYFLGFVYSYFLINIYIHNQNISPYFIILLLWYPGFENFFSLLRKLSFKKSPTIPDQNHLHQLIFFYLKKKINLDIKIINSLSGNLIIFL